MDITDEQSDKCGYLDSQRETIRASLDEIVNDVGTAMRDEGLKFPLYITVPSQGHSLALIATPLDPSQEDWQRASTIVRRVIEKTIGCGSLRGRELTCAIANAASVTAAEITQD
jgi:hypothetical protein